MRSLFSRIFGHKCSFSAATKMEVEVHCPFVGLLSDGDKKRFYHKLYDMMKTVHLHEKGVPLSRTNRMLIATPAAILTLGCKQLNWHRFRHIFVYPKAYKNNRTGNYHYGETSSVGSIVLSWKRVKEGIDDPDDALHLLYHE